MLPILRCCVMYSHTPLELAAAQSTRSCWLAGSERVRRTIRSRTCVCSGGCRFPVVLHTDVLSNAQTLLMKLRLDMSYAWGKALEVLTH